MPDNQERISVHVVDSINQRPTSKPLQLPTEIPSGTIAAGVAKLFGHVLVDNNGHQYNYRFRMENKTIIHPDQTLRTAKVKSQSTLYLTYEPQAATREA